jgi:hypothetical protein
MIVGVSESDLGLEVFRWTAAEGMQGLGIQADAVSVSSDGSTILAGQNIWDENNGVRNLDAVLNQLSVPNLAGWGGGLVGLAMSADGRTIVGVGANPQGDTEAWRTVLPENARAPEFVNAPASSYQVQAEQNLSFTVSATDGDANQLVLYRLLGSVPPGVLFTGDTFSWTPTTVDLGDHVFTLRAYDDGLPSRFTDVQFTITVTA